MKFKIGFVYDEDTSKEKTKVCSEKPSAAAPRRSVVQVRFPGRSMSLAYYNDRFDLKPGDLVYVDGKLEGQCGRVLEVHYNFKIKISDYKRVIARVDTDVKGRFYHVGSHFVTFDNTVLSPRQAALWFRAPLREDEEFVSGRDESSFCLADLRGMGASADRVERGREYYVETRVRYLSVDGSRGYAIVEGRTAYEVEFEYCDGQISNLTCSCFCSGTCKHAVAAVLQLKETLEAIEQHNAAAYERTGYFAAVEKETLFRIVIDGKKTGSLVLE